MSNKEIVLMEDKHVKDNASVIKKTRVKVYVEGTDECVFEGSNKVIVSGSAFTAAKHFNITPKVTTPSYNILLNLDNTVNEPFDSEGIRREEIVYLFAVGTDGCGIENSQVYDVDYTTPILPENLIPFRYQLETADLNNELRKKYFGKKTLAGQQRIAYYFKAFETEPVFNQIYADGTSIDENVFTTNRTEEVESYVELKLNISKNDVRDYFIATTGIDDARINSVSLLTAYKSQIDGYTYFQNIRPLTKINFPNESLIDPTKGLDIIYQIYY